VRYAGADAMGHTFLRYAKPEEFGDVPPADLQKYGGALDAYFEYLDEEIGNAMADLGPGDLLLVMSSFGMEPESLSKRLLAKVLGRPEQSGTHERAPDGFLLAYGTNVAPSQAQRGSLVDLAPTVLYYMGLPVGRDMDGFVRFDLFQRAFTAEHSLTYIASHER
jgi:predicted AlkP superfamily phosphohydrolase/phosphomutase